MSAGTTWRYAVTVLRGDGEDVYEVREVYTGPDGSSSWTKDAVGPSGDSWGDLAEALIDMQRDVFGRRVLDITDEANPVWMRAKTMRGRLVKEQ